MVDFVKNRCRIAPAWRALELNRAEYSPLQDTLGPGSIATILIAQEIEYPACVDDRVLAQFAREVFGLRTGWTQCVVAALERKGKLSADRYSELVASLVRMGYVFVPVRSQDIIALLKKSHYSLTPDLLSSLRALRGPDVNLQGAVKVSAGIVKTARNDGLVVAELDLLTDALVMALMSGRDRSVAIAAFQSELGSSLSDHDPLKKRLIQSLSLLELCLGTEIRAQPSSPGKQQ